MSRPADNAPAPVNPGAGEPRPSAGAPVQDRFPPGITYIIGNEAAERFSYYGMRAILYVHMAALFRGFVEEADVAPEVASAAQGHATEVTHLFFAGVYAFPLLGAILADRLIGKYAIIFWVSILYCGGHAVLAASGRTEIGMYLGLALIAVGSGGIKPCVSAIVGDQFTRENAHLVTKVYQIFYFIINFGSFFSTLLTPWLYRRFGSDVAFGVPGVLMAVATIVFWMGRKRFVRMPPVPGGRLGLLDAAASILFFVPLAIFAFFSPGKFDARGATGLEVVGAYIRYVGAECWAHWTVSLTALALGFILFSFRQRLEPDRGFLAILLYSWKSRKRRQPGEGFFGPARRAFGDEAADGPPAVLRIMLVFSMVSVFWALFDQHSSTWIEQAKRMDLTFEFPRLPALYVFAATVILATYALLWILYWVSNRPLQHRWTAILVSMVALGLIASFGAHAVSPAGLSIELKASQSASLNPLLVMIIIPGLNFLVYRPLARRGITVKPLARMTIGMFLASLAFVAVAILQLAIDERAATSERVSVLWQVIPYILLTTSEVLVSVTGLEFAYTQAPRAMKSTIMGFWYLCVSFGNLLVATLSWLQTESLERFFWTFAGLMAGAAVIFALLAAGYRGKSYLQQGNSAST